MLILHIFPVQIYNMLNTGRSDEHKQAYLTQLCRCCPCCYEQHLCAFCSRFSCLSSPHPAPSIKVSAGIDVTPFSNFTPLHFLPHPHSPHDTQRLGLPPGTGGLHKITFHWQNEVLTTLKRLNEPRPLHFNFLPAPPL